MTSGGRFNRLVDGADIIGLVTGVKKGGVLAAVRTTNANTDAITFAPRDLRWIYAIYATQIQIVFVLNHRLTVTDQPLLHCRMPGLIP